MKLEENYSYFIDYKPDGKDNLELAYCGPGTYTGKFLEDSDGDQLYLMSHLNTSKGFSNDGWFALSDIKGAICYEQKKEIK